jgi:hypothetical protein
MDKVSVEALRLLGFEKQELKVRMHYAVGKDQFYDHAYCLNRNVYFYFTEDNKETLLDVKCEWLSIACSSIGLNQLKGILYYSYLPFLNPPNVNRELFRPQL